MSLLRKCTGEFIGTFFYVFLVSVTVAVTYHVPKDLFRCLIAALVSGASYTLIAYTVGNASGCQINPIVTVGMCLIGRMNKRSLIGFLVCQIAGGTAGVRLAAAFTDGLKPTAGNMPEISLPVNIMIFLLVFVYVYAYLTVQAGNKRFRKHGKIIIGAVQSIVCFAGFVLLRYFSVNSAETLGMLLSSSDVSKSVLAVFHVVQICGALSATLVFGIRKVYYMIRNL